MKILFGTVTLTLLAADTVVELLLDIILPDDDGLAMATLRVELAFWVYLPLTFNVLAPTSSAALEARTTFPLIVPPVLSITVVPASIWIAAESAAPPVVEMVPLLVILLVPLKKWMP